MEEITNIIETYRTSLRRIMDVKVDQKTASVRIANKGILKKPLMILLWVLFGCFAVFIIAACFMEEDEKWVFIGILATVAIALLFIIRILTYNKIAYLDDAKFEFSGQLRKRRVFSLADYAGAETIRTIKDFPEEFYVKFNTEKGVKRFKLADLNKGFAKNIQPNHEAVSVLWETIIKQMSK